MPRKADLNLADTGISAGPTHIRTGTWILRYLCKVYSSSGILPLIMVLLFNFDHSLYKGHPDDGLAIYFAAANCAFWQNPQISAAIIGKVPQRYAGLLKLQ